MKQIWLKQFIKIKFYTKYETNKKQEINLKITDINLSKHNFDKSPLT